MNVIEAYIKFRGGLVILVSGLPGCGKSLLGKKIGRDFKITYLEESDYYKKEYDVEITLPDGVRIKNLHSDDAVDWTKLNEDLEKHRAKGVVLSGHSFPAEKITVPVDYHIHLAISKQKCIEKRRDYLEKNKEKYPEEYALIGSATEKLKLNQLIFPYYLESRERAKIDKYIQGTEMTDDQIYDEAFQDIIALIEHYLYEERPNLTKTQESKPEPETSISPTSVEPINPNQEDSTTSSSEIHDGPVVYLESPEDARFWYDYEDQKHGL